MDEKEKLTAVITKRLEDYMASSQDQGVGLYEQFIPEFVDAALKYDFFKDNPDILPTIFIQETSGGRNITREGNAINYGVADPKMQEKFAKRDVITNLRASIEEIAEVGNVYSRFRTGKPLTDEELADFAKTYEPANPNYPSFLIGGRKLYKLIEEQINENTPSPTPTPTPTPIATITPYQVKRYGLLRSPIPSDEYNPIKAIIQRAGEGIKSGIKNIKEIFEPKWVDLSGPITSPYGARNPADIYSKGINYGTDIAVAKGTPINLPTGNWKVLDSFSGATAEGPNNPQRGINRGYGNSVLVQNMSTGEKLRFSHLSQVNVKPGQTLSGGLIGKSGATGNVVGKTGQHVDLEYYDQNGRISDVTKSNYWSPTRKVGGAVQNVAQNVVRDVGKLTQGVVSPARADYQPINQTPTSKKPYSEIKPNINYSPTQTSPIQSRSYQSVNTPISSSNSQIIQKGATLSGIANQNKTTIARLMQLNPQITNPNLIKAGASLRLK